MRYPSFVCASLMSAALSITVSSATATSDDQGSGSLKPGSLLERELGLREEHRYRVPLTSGEAARVTVEQRGVDLTVQVRVDDREVIRLDDESRPRGEERIDVVADRDTTYTIVVTASPGKGRAGSYAIGIASLGAATDVDRSMYELLTLRTNAARAYEREQNEDACILLERALAIAERMADGDAKLARVAADLAEITGGNSIGESLSLRIFATLICDLVPPFTQHSTNDDPQQPDPVRLGVNGDFAIDDTLTSVPPECSDPVLLIRTLNNTKVWIAAGLPKNVAQ